MRRHVQALLLVGTVLLLASCSNGQLVDASGENGGGGLAFVSMCIMIFVFIAALFFVDKVRSRKMDE